MMAQRTSGDAVWVHERGCTNRGGGDVSTALRPASPGSPINVRADFTVTHILALDCCTILGERLYKGHPLGVREGVFRWSLEG